MIKKDIIIIGAGQMGELVSNIILRENKFSILGFIDKKKSKKKINGYKILGDDKFLYNKKFNCKFIAIAVTDLKIRFKIFKKLSKLNYKFPNIIDPSAMLDNNVKLKKGIIDSLTIVGTSVNILHDTKIGKNCLIGGGTVIGANITFKDNIHVGVGSVFPSKKIKIENDCLISSGSVVLSSLKMKSKVIGNPARVISINE